MSSSTLRTLGWADLRIIYCTTVRTSTMEWQVVAAVNLTGTHDTPYITAQQEYACIVRRKGQYCRSLT